MLSMASWPFFVIGFLQRHPSMSQNRLISPGKIFSPWRALILWNMVSGTTSRPPARLAFVVAFCNHFSPWRQYSLWRVSLFTSFKFPFFGSCLVHSFPTQLSQVRSKEHNKAFCHIFMAFPWITCKTSNQKCLIYIT